MNKDSKNSSTCIFCQYSFARFYQKTIQQMWKYFFLEAKRAFSKTESGKLELKFLKVFFADSLHLGFVQGERKWTLLSFNVCYCFLASIRILRNAVIFVYA